MKLKDTKEILSKSISLISIIVLLLVLIVYITPKDVELILLNLYEDYISAEPSDWGLFCHAPSSDDPWVVNENEICTGGEIYLTQYLRIESNASLTLQDACELNMAGSGLRVIEVFGQLNVLNKSIIQSNDSKSYLIYVHPGGSLNINGAEIRDFGLDSSYLRHQGIYVDQGTVDIRYSDLRSDGDYGIILNNVDKAIIRNNIISSHDDSAIYLISSSADIYRNEIRGGEYGVNVLYFKDKKGDYELKIDQNEIYDVNTAIYLDPPDDGDENETVDEIINETVDETYTEAVEETLNETPDLIFELNCSDGLDDDLDGLFDCNDTDCFEYCNVSIDSDVESDDTAESDVNETDMFETDNESIVNDTGDETLNLSVELNCTDGLDNDLDNLTDCDDLDCTDICNETETNGTNITEKNITIETNVTECTELSFVNTNLRDAICLELNESSGCTLTDCDVVNVSILNLSNYSISNLTGLDQFNFSVNSSLDLSYNCLNLSNNYTLSYLDNWLLNNVSLIYEPQNNCSTELCNNSLDDDLDGLFDCNDSDCFEYCNI